jgi:glycerate kinase
MSAAQVAESISQNIPATIGRKIITLADGGEGSLERISQSVQGQWIDCEVQDPLFRKIKASYY